MISGDREIVKWRPGPLYRGQELDIFGQAVNSGVISKSQYFVTIQVLKVSNINGFIDIVKSQPKSCSVLCKSQLH